MRKFKFLTIDDDAKIDMTPMLDIVFIMLIFFIVTASFLKESGLPLNIPEDNPPTDTDKISIILQVSSSDEILFGGRVIDFRAIGANLKRKMSELDNPSVVIQVHPNASNNMMLKAVDQVRDADITDFVVSPIKL